MRRIKGNRREHRGDAPLEKSFCGLAGFRIKLAHRHYADRLLGKRREQLFVPAFVLVLHKQMHRRSNFFKLLLRGESVRPRVAGTVLDALKKTGNAHLDEFVQIVRGDGEKFYALQQRISGVARLFEHPPVELQPL
jgi:hypothetical protein